MDMSRFDSADNIITIRISQREYDELCNWVNELNWNSYRYRNKATISKLARQIIRYCLNRRDIINDILKE